MGALVHILLASLFYIVSLSVLASDYTVDVGEDSAVEVATSELFPLSGYEVAYKQIVSYPSNGTVTLSAYHYNQLLIYRPHDDFCGTDSITASFTVVDDSDTIGPVNPPYDEVYSTSNFESPSFTNDGYFILEPEDKIITFNVNCVNDLPYIWGLPDRSTFKNGIEDLTTNEDVNKVVGFTIGDVETAATSLTVSVVSSSNTALLPTSRITLGGSGASRT
ncbi:hypothetical protein AAEU32_11350, partial [Pseudoalteromonas sp. SSDWG2]|uniref:hypothetical protein n=1 Tax=Pseudoalteromonas sp. SSDWG2 TaxID=3139391 RepID=UPI003BAB2D31